MDMIQDWMIINKIKMGDPDAWDILVHKYYDSVYFYCVRRCYGDCDIASDLTQDIFLKLVESLPRYRFIGKFQNYLYTMAVNTCNNYLKKRHIEQIELTDNFTTDLDTSLIDEILHDERKETVQKALDLLPEIQREVVILRYYHDLKVKDIATITGVGVSTVQSRIYQGLRKLELPHFAGTAGRSMGRSAEGCGPQSARPCAGGGTGAGCRVRHPAGDPAPAAAVHQPDRQKECRTCLRSV